MDFDQDRIARQIAHLDKTVEDLAARIAACTDADILDILKGSHARIRARRDDLARELDRELDRRALTGISSWQAKERQRPENRLAAVDRDLGRVKYMLGMSAGAQDAATLDMVAKWKRQRADLVRQRDALVVEVELDRQRSRDRLATASSTTPPTSDTPKQPTSAPTMTAAPFSPPQRVRVHPTLAAAFLAHFPAVGRVYYLLRGIDADGRGWLRYDLVVDVLAGVGTWGHVSPRRVRGILDQGHGKVWSWDRAAGVIWLYSPATVAVNLDTGRLRGGQVWVMARDLAAGIKRVRATFYAASFDAQRDPSPVTRTAKRAITGVPERTQRVYDQVVGTNVLRNVAVTGHRWGDSAARQQIAQRRGNAVFEFKDWRGKHGTKERGASYVAYGLPNSYESALERAPRGRQKKHNKRIDLVECVGQGNGAKFVRMYHADGKAAGKAFDRHSDGDHYWRAGRALQPAARRRSKLAGVDVWHVLSFEGVTAGE